MDARNYFATSPNPLKQNQFGGTIGGPILKGKLFYFGSYQGTRQNTAVFGQVAFVPTAAERTGDFSDLLPGTQLVNPYTGVPYNNNQVPLTALDPTAQFLLQHIPDPNGPGRQLTYNGTPSIQNTNEYLAKIDYNLGSKHHLSGRYFQLNYSIPIILPSDSNVLEGNTADPQNLSLKNVSVVDIYTISSHFLLNTYFGYTSQTGETLSPAPFTIQDAGSLIAQTTNLKPTLNVGVSGNFTIGEQPATGIWDRSDWSIRQVATFLKGAHQLEFGGEVRHVHVPMGNSYQANGVYTFSNSLSGDNVRRLRIRCSVKFYAGRWPLS